jgi:hypothetical protein
VDQSHVGDPAGGEFAVFRAGDVRRVFGENVCGAEEAAAFYCGKESWGIGIVINSRTVREVLKVFKVHLLVDWLLGVFPRNGKFGDYTYPVTSLEALIVEKEIFKAGIYDGVFNLSGVKDFLEIGCNPGFFSIWIECKEDSETALVFAERI